ncbi:MAG: hypothetical protein F6K00_09430 [Leptolyngbya sp. SIOISBB]|nr:hypothetical protein [Leptolyngbya sp. SIOISBB]
MKKPQASYTSRRDLTEISRNLHLGRVLEEAYGAGAMTAAHQRAPKRSGWTLEQLLQMSAGKSMYN